VRARRVRAVIKREAIISNNPIKGGEKRRLFEGDN